MFKKIVLLLFVLLTGLLAIAIYLDLMLEQQATAFCDAIPLDTRIDAVHFKQTVLRTQPAVILGSDDMNDISFSINARRAAITEQEIAASGMDEFFNKAGAKGKQAYIWVWFFGSLPFAGYGCEIHLVQQRVSSKHTVALD